MYSEHHLNLPEFCNGCLILFEFSFSFPSKFCLDFHGVAINSDGSAASAQQCGSSHSVERLAAKKNRLILLCSSSLQWSRQPERSSQRPLGYTRYEDSTRILPDIEAYFMTLVSGARHPILGYTDVGSSTPDIGCWQGSRQLQVHLSLEFREPRID